MILVCPFSRRNVIFARMNNSDIYRKALALDPLTEGEALQIYRSAPLAELMLAADALRREQAGDPQVVTWQIDRNVNITNVCISGCKFCNFHSKPHQSDKAYITTIEEYDAKVRETLACCRAGCTRGWT